MSYPNLIVEKQDGGIALITIDRPQVRNALDLETWRALDRAFADLDADPDCGAIIITGAGDKAFAAGADINELRARDLAGALAAHSQRALLRIEAVEKPVIAAVNGFALGGGCELALACDIRIASERARFGQPEVNLGIMPGAGGTQRLATLVGLGKAKELILTGDIVDAAEALRIGLANKVVMPEELMDAAREMAGKILSKGPLAVRMAKVALNARAQFGPQAGMLIERLGQACLITTRDKAEGTAAFLEKRPPRFEGH